MYAKKFSNIILCKCNAVGNMLPKNETFFIHEQHVSGNMLLETVQHTQQRVARKHVSGNNNVAPNVASLRCEINNFYWTFIISKIGRVEWYAYLSERPSSEAIDLSVLCLEQ